MRRGRGGVLVEAALSLPILVLLVGGTIDLARHMLARLEAARLARFAALAFAEDKRRAPGDTAPFSAAMATALGDLLAPVIPAGGGLSLVCETASGTRATLLALGSAPVPATAPLITAGGGTLIAVAELPSAALTGIGPALGLPATARARVIRPQNFAPGSNPTPC